MLRSHVDVDNDGQINYEEFDDAESGPVGELLGDGEAGGALDDLDLGNGEAGGRNELSASTCSCRVSRLSPLDAPGDLSDLSEAGGAFQ